MHINFFVLENASLLDEALDTWIRIGITGITIKESSGIARKRRRLLPIHLTYSVSEFQEEGNYTLCAVVKQKNLIKKCLIATEKITGDLDNPSTGVFAAWPLEMAKGVAKKYNNQNKEK